jgi:uncharacterized membrane protein
MTLLGMFLVLVVPFGVMTALGQLIPDVAMSRGARGRVGVSLLFLITGVAHFLKTAEIAAMIPPFIPGRLELAYVTGVLEILGAIGLWIPHLTHLTGDALVLYAICVMPTNIYATMNYVNIGGHWMGPAYLFIRIPFQFFLMGWIYVSAIREEEPRGRRKAARPVYARPAGSRRAA